MKTLLCCIFLSSMVAPIQADMKKDIQSHERKIEDLEEAIGAMAQQMYVMQFHIEQLEQNIHDLNLKMEYKYGKNCVESL